MTKYQNEHDEERVKGHKKKRSPNSDPKSMLANMDIKKLNNSEHKELTRLLKKLKNDSSLKWDEDDEDGDKEDGEAKPGAKGKGDDDDEDEDDEKKDKDGDEDEDEKPTRKRGRG